MCISEWGIEEGWGLYWGTQRSIYIVMLKIPSMWLRWVRYVAIRSVQLAKYVHLQVKELAPICTTERQDPPNTYSSFPFFSF